MKERQPKTYHVKRIANHSIHTADDHPDPYFRKGAEELSDFIYPWENYTAPSMTFKSVHDNDWLYCFFQVEDDDIRTYVNTNEKAEVIYGDRVEIFFRQDEQLSSYYCLEVDPHARIYDYQAAHYRKFDVQWSWPSGHLRVRADRHPAGYSVKLALSLKSLHQLGLLKNEQLQVGLFRGKCIVPTRGNPEMRWISWAKPDSPTPDFHIPSAFGIFQLE